MVEHGCIIHSRIIYVAREFSDGHLTVFSFSFKLSAPLTVFVETSITLVNFIIGKEKKR